jgi:hypothetical protein
LQAWYNGYRDRRMLTKRHKNNPRAPIALTCIEPAQPGKPVMYSFGWAARAKWQYLHCETMASYANGSANAKDTPTGGAKPPKKKSSGVVGTLGWGFGTGGEMQSENEDPWALMERQTENISKARTIVRERQRRKQQAAERASQEAGILMGGGAGVLLVHWVQPQRMGKPLTHNVLELTRWIGGGSSFQKHARSTKKDGEGKNGEEECDGEGKNGEDECDDESEEEDDGESEEERMDREEEEMVHRAKMKNEEDQLRLRVEEKFARSVQADGARRRRRQGEEEPDRNKMPVRSVNGVIEHFKWANTSSSKPSAKASSELGKDADSDYSSDDTMDDWDREKKKKQRERRDGTIVTELRVSVTELSLTSDSGNAELIAGDGGGRGGNIHSDGDIRSGRVDCSCSFAPVQYLVRGLRPGGLYTVRVRAGSIAGESPFSTPSTTLRVPKMLPRDRIVRTFERGKRKGQDTGFVRGRDGEEGQIDENDEDAREAREEAEHAAELERATEPLQVREMRGDEAGLVEVAALMEKALKRAYANSKKFKAAEESEDEADSAWVLRDTAIDSASAEAGGENSAAKKRRRLSYDVPMIVGAIGFGIHYLRGVCREAHDHTGLTPFDRRRKQLVEAGFVKLTVTAMHKSMSTLQTLAEKPIHGTALSQDEASKKEEVTERLKLTTILQTGASLLLELSKFNKGPDNDAEDKKGGESEDKAEVVGVKDDSVALAACEWVRREMVDAGVVSVTLRLLGIRRAPSVLKTKPPAVMRPDEKGGREKGERGARFGGMATALAVASQVVDGAGEEAFSKTDPFEFTTGTTIITLGKGVMGRARGQYSHRINSAKSIVVSDRTGINRTALRLETGGSNYMMSATDPVNDRSHEQISAGAQLRTLVVNNTKSTIGTGSGGHDLEREVREKLAVAEEIGSIKYMSRKEMEVQLLALCKAHPELHISRQLVLFVSETDAQAREEWRRQLQKEALGDDAADHDNEDSDSEGENVAQPARLTPREGGAMSEGESVELIAASVLASLRRTRRQRSTKDAIAQLKMLVEQLHHHCENDEHYREEEQHYREEEQSTQTDPHRQTIAPAVAAGLTAMEEEEQGEEWKDLMCDLRSSAIMTGRAVGDALLKMRMGSARARAATAGGKRAKAYDVHQANAAREAGAAAAEFVNSRIVISVGDKRRDLAEIEMRNKLRKNQRTPQCKEGICEKVLDSTGGDAVGSYQTGEMQEMSDATAKDVGCIRVSSVAKAAATAAQVACAAASCFVNGPGEYWPLLVRGVGYSTAFHYVKDLGGTDEQGRAAGTAADAAAALAYSGKSVELSLHSAQRMLALCKRIAVDNVKLEQRTGVNIDGDSADEVSEESEAAGKTLGDGMVMRPQHGYGTCEGHVASSMEVTARAAAAAAKRKARRRREKRKMVGSTEGGGEEKNRTLAPPLPPSAWETNEALSSIGMFILSTLSWNERTQQPVTGGLDAGGVVAGASPVWDECCRHGMATSVGVVSVCPQASIKQPLQMSSLLQSAQNQQPQAPFHRGVLLAGPIVTVSLLQLQLQLHRRLEVEEVLSRFSRWHSHVVRQLHGALLVDNRFEREVLIEARDAGRDLMREWRRRPMLSTLMGKQGEVVGSATLHHSARGATAAFGHSAGGEGEKWLRTLVLTADVMMMVRCGGFSESEKCRRRRKRDRRQSGVTKAAQMSGSKKSGRKNSAKVALDGPVWGRGGAMERADVFGEKDPNHNEFDDLWISKESHLGNSESEVEVDDADSGLWAIGGEVEQAVKLARMLHQMGEVWGNVMNEVDIVDEEQRQRADDEGPNNPLSTLRKANQSYRANGATSSVESLRDCVQKLEVWARNRQEPDAQGRQRPAGVALPFSMRSQEGRELLQSALFSLALHDAGASKDWVEAMRDVRASVEWQEWRATYAIAALSNSAATTIKYASFATEEAPMSSGMSNLSSTKGNGANTLADAAKHNISLDSTHSDAVTANEHRESSVSTRYFPSYSSCAFNTEGKPPTEDGDDPVEATTFELSASLLPDLFPLIGRLMWQHRKESSVVLPGLQLIGHVSCSRCYQHVMARGVRSDTDSSAAEVLPEGLGGAIPVQDNIELLTTLMWHHLPDPRAQRLGARALQQLSQASVLHQQRMSECTTVELLLRVLSYRHPKNKHIGAHVDNEGVVTALLPVLGNLAYNYEAYHASILSRMQRERRESRRRRRLVDLEWRQKRENEMTALESSAGPLKGNVGDNAAPCVLEDLGFDEDDDQEFAYQAQPEVGLATVHSDAELQKSIAAREERRRCRRGVQQQLEQRARLSSDKIKSGLKRGSAVRAILHTMATHKFSDKVNRVGLVALGNINHPTSGAVETDPTTAKNITPDGMRRNSTPGDVAKATATQNQLMLPTCALNAVLRRFLHSPTMVEWALWVGGKLANVFANEASSYSTGLAGVRRTEEFYLLLIAALHMNPSNAGVVHNALWSAAEIESALRKQVAEHQSNMGISVLAAAGDRRIDPVRDDRATARSNMNGTARPSRSWDSTSLEFGGAIDPLRKMHKMLDLVDADVNMGHHVRGRAKAMPPSVLGLVHRLKMAKARGSHGTASATALYEGVSMHADHAWRSGMRDARMLPASSSLSSISASAARFEEQTFGTDESWSGSNDGVSGGGRERGGRRGKPTLNLSVPECLDMLTSVAATRAQQSEKQRKSSAGGVESHRRNFRHRRQQQEWAEFQLDALREVVGGSKVVASILALGPLQMKLQTELERRLKIEEAEAQAVAAGDEEQTQSTSTAARRLAQRKRTKVAQQLKDGLKVGVQSLEALLLIHSGELFQLSKAQAAASKEGEPEGDVDCGGAHTPTPLVRRLMSACNTSAALEAVLQGLVRYTHTCYTASTNSTSATPTGNGAKTDGDTGGTPFVFVAHQPLLMQLVMQALFVHYYTNSSSLLLGAEEAIAQSGDGTRSSRNTRIASKSKSSLLSVGAEALRQSDLPGLLSRLLQLRKAVVSQCMHVIDALALHASNHMALMRYRAPQLVVEVCLVCWEAELVGGSEATATAEARPRNDWIMTSGNQNWSGGSTRHLPRLRFRDWEHSDYARAADEYGGRQTTLKSQRAHTQHKAARSLKSKFAHKEGVNDNSGLDKDEAEMVANIWAEARAVQEVDEAEHALFALERQSVMLSREDGAPANGMEASVVGPLLSALHRSEGGTAIAKERAGIVANRAHANLRKLRSRGTGENPTGDSGSDAMEDVPLSSSSAALFAHEESETSFLVASAEAYNKRPGEAFGRTARESPSKIRGMGTGISTASMPMHSGVPEQDNFEYGAWGGGADTFVTGDNGEGKQYAPASVVLSGMTLLARLALNHGLAWQLIDQGAALLGEMVLYQGKQGGRYAWRNSYQTPPSSTGMQGQDQSMSMSMSMDNSNDGNDTGTGAVVGVSARAVNVQLRFQCLSLLRRLANVSSLKIYERFATVRTVLMLIEDVESVLQTFRAGTVDGVVRGIASCTIGLLWGLSKESTQVQQMVVQAGGRAVAKKLAAVAKQMYSVDGVVAAGSTANYQEMQRMCRGLLSVLPLEGADRSQLRTGPIGFGRRATQ